MHLEDFDVEVVAERLGRTLRERGQQIDAEAHIAGLDDDGALGARRDLLFVRRRQTRRADHMNELRLGGESGKRHRRRGRGEIENGVGILHERCRIRDDLHAERANARKLARVLADAGRALAFEGAGHGKALRFCRGTHERAAHAAARAGDQKANVWHA